MEKKFDKRILKKTGEELQQYLHFKKRGGKLPDKTKYNRKRKHKGQEE